MAHIHTHTHNIFLFNLFFTVTHKRNSAFKCDICQHYAKTPESFIRHKLLHSRERPFGCKVCTLRFYTRNALNRHIESHSNRRPFPCDTCGLKFKSKRNLQQHDKKFGTECGTKKRNGVYILMIYTDVH